MRHFKSLSFVAGVLLLSISAGRTLAGYVEYNAAVQADVPTNYWHLSESLLADPAADVGSGGSTANNGAYTGGVTLQQAGPWPLGFDGGDRAARFNGADGYVDIPVNSENDLGTGDFTMSMWLNKDSNTGGLFIYNQRVDGGNFVSIAYTSALSNGTALGANYLALEAWQGVTEKLTVYGAADLFATSGWHHIAFTVDRDDAAATRLMVDGVDATTSVATLTTDDISEPAGVSIGRWSGGGSYYDGLIDEVAVFHSALGAVRLQEHYSAAQAVPEPGGMMLLLVGGSLLAIYGRWRSGKSAEICVLRA